jgi:type III restriction enzyme
MASGTIDQLIVNSPYREPEQHWSYERESRSFTLKPGRRPAGYVTATPGSNAFDDPGIFRELPLVNQIRPRVKAWREADHPGVSGVTKKLLSHWHDVEQRNGRRFFFCQLEAMETLVWLTEAPASERVGIHMPGDGGNFTRICTKMATGSGKTIVMSMVVAWHVLNKVAYPQDKRFSKNVFIVAPGLTVKNRLGVLAPGSAGNYYDLFNIVPMGLHDQMRQGRVMVRNWHTLMRLDPDAGPKVMKKGPESDEAFTRRVMVDLASAQNLLVINDEAHHAWRVPPKLSAKDFGNQELEEATQWIGGLDRIQKTRGILACYDMTATPFAPTGKRSGEETLFGWIASDFGLNDAIESGLVKTPRVVVRDDGTLTKDYKSRLYHIYMDDEVRDDLNRKAEPQEPLPDLVQNAYYLLGKDWLETSKRWSAAGFKVPPVMITVANRTETSSRIKYAFDRGKIRIDELCVPEKTLQIDSRVLDKAEAREEAPEIATDIAEPAEEEDNGQPAAKVSKKDQFELLRRIVGTVGQMGQPGEQIQNVISVGMLSEGWDAKTVTHIMGLRAFTSQLLCEQVVGRGLRRTSYDVNPETGLFEPEYVNIFGVPFTFLPHEGGEGAPPPPPPPKTEIKPLSERITFELTWPNIVRIDHEFRPKLTLNTALVKPLLIDAAETRTIAELAPIVEGKPEVRMVSEINLQELGQKFRMQRIIFETARDIFDQMQPTWKGSREALLAQLIRLVERFLASGKIDIMPPLFTQDPLRRRIVLTLNMNRIVQHIWEAIRFENTQALALVFDTEHPIRSTGDMRSWYTGRPCELTSRSHINFCVYDSTWEASESYVFDKNPNVSAWAKNDHLGFEVLYVFKGVVKKYRPDFLVRLNAGTMLVLEVKGQDSPENHTKREFLAEWVRAVNENGGFGRWESDVSFHVKDIEGVLARHSSASVAIGPGKSASIEALQRLSAHLSISNQDIARLLHASAEMIGHWASGETVMPPEIEVAVTAADTALRRMLAIFRPERLPDVIRQRVELFQGRSALDLILEGRIEEVADLYDAAFAYQG